MTQKHTHLSFHFLYLLVGMILFCLMATPVESHAKTRQITLFLGETKKVPKAKKNFRLLKCENTSIAAVSKNGRIHGRKAGKTSLTVKTKSGRKTYQILVKKQGLVYPSFSMMKGEHLDMAFSENLTKKVKWSSSRKSIATVSREGIVHARKKGRTTIKGVSGGHTYLCHLTVTPKEESIVYLTFDDGPNRYSTPKILNILKKHNVPATFFELKPANADFDLTKRVLKEGHTLALHGYQHKYDKIYKSEKIYKNNLDKQRALFFRKFGVWCTITRFPGGSSNTVSRYNPGIMTKITKKIHSWGYHYFDWNVSSGDAGDVKAASQVYRMVTSGLKKGRSNVVLMHDFNKNDKTINSLEKIIQYGKKHGYSFRAITASTDEIHHAVNN